MGFFFSQSTIVLLFPSLPFIDCFHVCSFKGEVSLVLETEMCANVGDVNVGGSSSKYHDSKLYLSSIQSIERIGGGTVFIDGVGSSSLSEWRSEECEAIATSTTTATSPVAMSSTTLADTTSTVAGDANSSSSSSNTSSLTLPIVAAIVGLVVIVVIVVFLTKRSTPSRRVEVLRPDNRVITE
eukprot:m.197094 g.197094  ORF g.197094 m.197094 type:complete len:183 (+) comp13680_c0_seq29:688-1236(+)